MNEFLTNGFATGVLTLDVAFLFKRFPFPNCNDGEATPSPEAEMYLQSLHEHIATKYVSTMFDEFGFGEHNMWSGVDGPSQEWHNDSCDEFNSNFLVYLDDGEMYNNFIEVKTPVEEFKIYPKKNQFVWLNQNQRFLHRATHTEGPRRVLSFEFKIPAIA